VLREFMTQLPEYVRGICAEALAPLAPSDRSLGLTLALADFYAWLAFNRAGVATDAAAALACDTVLSHIAREKEASV
jgi:hypothetical protein